jgi:hypothetical protein
MNFEGMSEETRNGKIREFYNYINNMDVLELERDLAYTEDRVFFTKMIIKLSLETKIQKSEEDVSTEHHSDTGRLVEGAEQGRAKGMERVGYRHGVEEDELVDDRGR